MVNMEKNIKNYFLNILLIIGLVFSTFITFIISSTYYNSFNSPDLGKYLRYINYFLGDLVSTEFEQGNLYYFLVALIVDIDSENINPRYYQEYIGYSIQFANFLIYLFFIFGLYKFLKKKGFQSNNIFITLILLNFFPPMVTLRLIFKPEILILSLFVWTLYFMEKYKESKNIIWLINFCTFFALIITTKLSGAIMVSIFFFVHYFLQIWKENTNKILLLLLLTTFISSFLIYENFKINNQLFFDVPSQEEYQDSPDVSFLYNVNFKDLIYSPYKDFHNNSLIGIVLLETFDDYFQLYWNSDSSLFHRNQNKPITHLSSYISIIFTIFLYSLIFYYATKFKRDRFIFLGPLIGITIMLLISFFSTFEKSSGDMLKNYYYSFFLILSFTFIVLNLLRNKIYINYLFILIYLISTMYIFGYPKSHDVEMENRISEQISVSSLCNLSSSIFNLNQNKCENEKLEICADLFSDYRKTLVVNREIVDVVLDPFESYEIVNNNISKSVDNIEDCNEHISNGWVLKDLYDLNKSPPHFNIFSFLLPALLILLFRKSLVT